MMMRAPMPPLPPGANEEQKREHTLMENRAHRESVNMGITAFVSGAVFMFVFLAAVGGIWLPINVFGWILAILGFVYCVYRLINWLNP